MSVTQDSLTNLLTTDTPLIDVRAPVEFAAGALPAAVNLPILNDDEREQIGICYKEQGHDAAVSLGYDLVCGEKKDFRIQSWLKIVESSPNTHLYCFRGGQRSQIACEWLEEAGILVPRIDGGYKRMRQRLLSVFDDLPQLIIVSGKTGTGKTQFLKKFTHVIDLEGIANHRGSAFGGRLTGQPSQVDFENSLAIQFLKHNSDTDILLEDEGRLIGRVHVPQALQEKMKQSPILVIEEAVDVRADNIHHEYIVDQWQDYQQRFGTEALQPFESYLLAAIDAIRKRLGNVRHGEVRSMMVDALERQMTGDLEGHRSWITTLLTDYYDPMYEYQLNRKTGRVRFTGTGNEVAAWYRDNQGELA
jgi:tRNA 2-selenouridine synthase